MDTLKSNYVQAMMVRVLLCAVTIAAVGCDSHGPPPPDGQIAIERVAKWYQLYRADNKGKAPPDEDKFYEYIEKKMQKDNRTDLMSREELFTSLRDGKPYIIAYGKAATKNWDKNVAVQEQEGYRGKKLIAFEAAWCKEVDDAELKALLESAE